MRMPRLTWVLLCSVMMTEGVSGDSNLSARVSVGAVPAAVASGHAARIGDLVETAKIQLTVVLLPKRDELAAQAVGVNDPKSRNFHHFLTLAEVKAQFMPTDADVASVEAWARSGGLSEVQRWNSNHAIVLQGTVAQVNALLNVKLGQYRLNGSTYYANDRAPTVSPDLAPKVADILGLNSLERFHPASSSRQGLQTRTDVPHVAEAGFVVTESVGADANLEVPHGRTSRIKTPQILGSFPNAIEPRDLWNEQVYNYDGLARFSHCCNPNHLPTGSPIETSIAIIGANKPDPNDLKQFFSPGLFNLASNISIVEVGSPQCCDDEMTMDAEWAGATSNSMGANNDTAHIYVYAGGGDTNGDLLNAWEEALSDNKTRIASTSYSNIEPNYGGIGRPSISDFTDVIRSMTLMGWTLVAAAGDSGGDGSYGDENNPTCVRGSVLYPPTDPNVVAAGGTNLSLSRPLGYVSETAWCGNACGSNTACSATLTAMKTNGGGGGGGCSDTFPATSWNPTGCGGSHRAIPDISLNGGGLGQVVYYSYAPPKKPACANNVCFWNGSSIVAPELAGFFAQENSYLLRLGSSCGPNHDAPCAPLGSAGAALYAAVRAPHNPYYDITVGNTSNGLSKGYDAAPGYDLATGLGSANMMQLAWAINYYLLSSGSTPPIVSFGGAQLNTQYSGPATVNFVINAANRGIAGYTAAVDRDPLDTKTKPTPGSGDPFWDGPQVVGASSGALAIPFSPGCHTVYVRAWDNLGQGNAQASYGPICMGTNTQCSFSESACPDGGGLQSYTVSCPMLVDFSVNGQFQSEGQSFTGQEQAARQNTYVKACLPQSDNCQAFTTTSTETCPIHPIHPPPAPIHNCKVCTDTNRQCVEVPGGYRCEGSIF